MRSYIALCRAVPRCAALGLARFVAGVKSEGVVVYLKISLELLSRRLGNLKGRGVVLKEGQTLASLYDERVPLYEKYADIVVDEEDKDLEGSLQVVLEALKNRGDKA